MREPASGLRLLLIGALACTLMVIDHKHLPQFDKMRLTLAFVVYPIQKMVDFPITKLRRISGFFVTQSDLHAENQWYKDEYLLQQGRLQKLAALETENLHLRQLLQSGSQVKADDLFIANIINIDPDPFMQQIIINKGQKDGVYVGQTIIDSDGIMGSIVTVGEEESRAILITDASHAVPVEDVRNGLRAIAVGTGNRGLELRHVPNTTDIEVGDIMITSGLGGRFPIGFPVGIVTKVKHEPNKPFATIILNPSAKLDRGRHILLVQNNKNKAKIKAITKDGSE